MAVIEELRKDQRFIRLMRRCAVVEKCMETLSDQERQALRLRYLEGDGNAKIAKALGVSQMKARGFEYGARRIILDMLYGDDEDE